MIINADTVLVIEDSALAGVKRVGKCVAQDMEKVFGRKNDIVSSIAKAGDNYIIAATIGYSDIADGVATDDIEGKREVYKYTDINGHLAIIGSDKRGTIYGLFHLSELLGVSPLVDWFLLNPAQLDSYELTADKMITSKEPSVRFRGFFINDEWPAFGNWCTKNFGGFNAKAYEQIFLLLLRMKGNYMWPAMWSAIFPDDGPGLANEELADELGVVMGMSHHEPCLRQGEEYRYLRGKDSIYGDAWNFRTNEAGITKFWEDGLARSGKFENVITVGMRGECDTAIMGKDATLKDNIDLLRDVLKTQNRLIRENVDEDLSNVPRMLALYKEVEPYFYGDENTKGLMDDPELEGVTLMLCDDNYGNLRTVPTEHMREHNGGYGMYYHFDYHGFPISFEWINSSYLPKVWEQMTTAYEFGIRDLWIVNVGDLFSMEYPLAYFLDLAYDYDKWGISNINSAQEYTRHFVGQSFGRRCNADVTDKMYELLMGYTRIAHKRRPEAMNCDVYAPHMYSESEELLEDIDRLNLIADEIENLVEEDLKLPVFELFYYPAKGNLNVQKLQLQTGLNHAYAQIGCNAAMDMAEAVNEALKYDEELVNRLHEIADGKWYGMGLSEHIGFRNWCEEECRYPILHTFKPGNKPRVIVSIPGTNQHSEGGDWTGKMLVLGDFMTPGVKEAYIELSSAGAKGSYEITVESDCLALDNVCGTVEGGEIKRIKVTYDISKANSEAENYIRIKTGVGNIVILVPLCTESEEDLSKKYESGTYVWLSETNRRENVYNPYRYLAMEAAGFTGKTKTEVCGKTAEFIEIPEYGKTRSAVKAFPVNLTYDEENAPGITYTFEVPADGEYLIEAYMNPSNAPFMDGHLYYGIAINGGRMQKVNALPKNFKVGDHQDDWSKGVLDNIRISASSHKLCKGVNNVTFYALSPGFVLEKIVVYKEGERPEESYLGPKETYRTK